MMYLWRWLTFDSLKKEIAALKATQQANSPTIFLAKDAQYSVIEGDQHNYYYLAGPAEIIMPKSIPLLLEERSAIQEDFEAKLIRPDGTKEKRTNT